MEPNSDLKYMLAYLWILSLAGAFFYGNEWGMVNKVDRGLANNMIQDCNEFIAGEIE